MFVLILNVRFSFNIPLLLYYYMVCSSFKILLILYRMFDFSSIFEKCDDTKLVIISCISKKNKGGKTKQDKIIYN
jgi:hypothetical protein